MLIYMVYYLFIKNLSTKMKFKSFFVCLLKKFIYICGIVNLKGFEPPSRPSEDDIFLIFV